LDSLQLLTYPVPITGVHTFWKNFLLPFLHAYLTFSLYCAQAASAFSILTVYLPTSQNVLTICMHGFQDLRQVPLSCQTLWNDKQPTPLRFLAARRSLPTEL
jgi:hypothetical protein